MDIQNEMLQLARQAKQAARIMAKLSSAVKDDLLRRMAAALEQGNAELLAANE
jgi:glutamate-5-semialdehyde dehydrogenase